MNIIIIIGILMLSAFLVPVWILTQKQKKNRKKLEQYLTSLEREKNLKITEHETWRNKVIGIDRNNGKAIYVIQNADGNLASVVDLMKVSKCMAEHSTISAESKSSYQAVTGVRIRFVYRDKGQPDHVFEVFNEERDQTIGTEIRLAEAWVQKFKEIIKSSTKAA
jgi:hypothetical protein